jgi:stage III sporulation protein AH
MNAKRQTIWLVSMLSLMVVLSAYYLFTEDVNKLNLAAADTTQKPQEVKIDMSQIDNSAAIPDANKSTEKAAEKAADPTAAGTGAKADAKTDAKTDAKANAKTDAQSAASSSSAKQSSTAADKDAQMLQQIASQTTSASDFFTTEQMKNNDLMTKKSDQLLATITDPKQKPETVAKATNDLEALSGEQEKIDNLVAMLLKDYPQAVVSQEGKKWKIIVQSQKLEKSQGVTIVDMVMKELDAAPENIKIQYIKP